MSITQANKKAEIMVLALTINNSILPLKNILYIYHLVFFKKNQAKVQTLLDSSNQVNNIILAYISKLKLKICFTNVKAQKIEVLLSKHLQLYQPVFILMILLANLDFFKKSFCSLILV